MAYEADGPRLTEMGGGIGTEVFQKEGRRCGIGQKWTELENS